MAPQSERLAGTERALRPPPRLSLSEWADRFFYLSPESAAEPGRWRTLPYQRGVMDAVTDPAVERVTWMKSARVGATKIMNAAIGYYMHQDPCPILVVQPTIEDAEGYSKEEIAPMLRDVEVLRALAPRAKRKSSAATILHKGFPGGVLSMVGANSARGFRRVSRRIIALDELDGYPAAAGLEGDQVTLAIKRSEYYANRKILAWSTPLVAGASRIEAMFGDGDRRRYHVPCPQCGHMDILSFREDKGRGHFMRWPDGDPRAAFFVCRRNGCIIEHRDKLQMLERGEWRAEREFRGHASFHIWAAYSLSPNATWGHIAEEFVDAKRKGPVVLQTFVNTALGETWQERGEAPDWERLYERRETYAIGTVPAGVVILTAGVDVQKDRLVYDVTGWAETKESWLVEAGELHGDTSSPVPWAKLDELLARRFPRVGGGDIGIAGMGVDSGYNTQQVYTWCRRHGIPRVIATKGVRGSIRTPLIGSASAVDVTLQGRASRRSYRVFPIGVDVGKSELYGWLRQAKPKGEAAYPPGFCHFPEVGEEYFLQLTAEHLVAVRKPNGVTVYEWHVLPNRQNHWLDARIIARAVASLLGLDRARPPASSPGAPAAAPETPRAPVPRTSPRAPAAPRPNGWLGPRRPRPGGWLGKRR